MYLIPPAKVALSLFNPNGLVRNFRNKAEAVRDLGYDWISNKVGPQFRRVSQVESFLPSGPSEALYRSCDFVIRDDCGNSLTRVDFLDFKPSYVSKWDLKRYSCWNGEGPVPFTAKRRGRHSYFRRVGTFGARRDSQVLDDEPAPRAARNMSNIPNSYDDISRGRSHSWKNHRHQQWKGAPMSHHL